MSSPWPPPRPGAPSRSAGGREQQGGWPVLDAEEPPANAPQPWPAGPGDPQHGEAIGAYAPPRRHRRTWVWVLVAAVLVGVVVAAIFLRPQIPGGGASPTPTPSAAPTATAGPGMPFTMPGSPQNNGRWEVLRHSWTPEGLVVRVKVTADQGRVSYGFLAFSNNQSIVYEPEIDAPQPQIDSGSLRAGESAEGNILIQIPQGDATLILTTQQGRQMSALPIPG